MSENSSPLNTKCECGPTRPASTDEMAGSIVTMYRGAVYVFVCGLLLFMYGMLVSDTPHAALAALPIMGVSGTIGALFRIALDGRDGDGP